MYLTHAIGRQKSERIVRMRRARTTGNELRSKLGSIIMMTVEFQLLSIYLFDEYNYFECCNASKAQTNSHQYMPFVSNPIPITHDLITMAGARLQDTETGW